MVFSRTFHDLLQYLFSGKRELEKDISSSSQAYIGDSLFDLYIRLYLLEHYPGKGVEFLHQKSIQYSNSNSQRLLLEKIYQDLPKEEKRIVDRTRKSLKNVPSQIHLLDYQVSTALESLLGYLFLKKDFQRLLYLLEAMMTETKTYEKGLS